MDKELLANLTEKFGDAFYTLESEQFRRNYLELKQEFQSIYPNFNIAYSYKTNYTPKLCGIVNELGGYAEVVSDMEAELAFRVGVKPEKIIWNGPYKNAAQTERLLVAGGTVNIDSVYETGEIVKIAAKHPDVKMNLGIRCNFDVGDGLVSIFVFDIYSEEFKKTLDLIGGYGNLNLINLQCHFATRSLESWKPRTEKMLALLDGLNIMPDRVDLGGGLFGKMEDSLKAQFGSYIPEYREYAETVATAFKKRFGDCAKKPELVIEPGSALVGDCMKFVAKVVSIKKIRGRHIATLSGSVYNINPTLNGKNPPVRVVAMGKKQEYYADMDFGGFTCIESDYLYRHFNGSLAVGDFVVFGNVGSYSIVLKPPFILPNFPVIDISDYGVEIIKRGECFDDIFRTFAF